MRIAMVPGQMKINQIVSQAVREKIIVPPYRREFVWSPEQVKLQVESLARDYPVGTLLLWDPANFLEAETPLGSPDSLWLIDGQQRTTALCLLMGQKPCWWEDVGDWYQALVRYNVMVDLLAETAKNGFEFALPGQQRRRDPRWLPVNIILAIETREDLSLLAHKQTGKIAGEAHPAPALFEKVHARLQALWQIREREISVIKLNHEVEEVAEISARLNQTGHKAKEDVFLALAAMYSPIWAREQHLPTRHAGEEQGWDIDAGIFIRTMIGIGQSGSRLLEVPKHFWQRDTLKTVWNRTQSIIADATRRLSDFGIFPPHLCLPRAASFLFS